MDFVVLPPEINSARIYAGPGAGPMLVASATWDALAAELFSALASYTAAVTGLAAEWQGPSSVAMTAASVPYSQWLTTTAAQAEQTAAQAKAAAVAYEAAFTATVPPPVIAANRALLMSLVATNILGQNTPAIMATEAHYMEMWAQDVAAMSGYAGAAAAATRLTPFTPPQQNTNQAGIAGQAASVAQAQASSAAGNTQSILSQVGSAVSGPGASTGDSLGMLNNLASPVSNGSSMLSSVASVGMSAGSSVPSLGSATQGLDQGALALTPAFTSGLSPATAALSSTTTAAGTPAGSVTASLGRAVSLGGLSAPQGWATAAPAVSPTAAGLSSAGSAAATPGTPGNMLGGLPLAGTNRGTNMGMTPRFEVRPQPHPVMPRPAV
ncbi:PPE family protein [Mycobacterium sp. 1274756.6]|uniref:PPE family protein n=1 Tax=Mycobacterium sp. 1274756.6 TaxID=1834076 RepID=UPI000800F655|nr:PPE family protein [Mycobacterium sp. 1274756.6]OBJ67920.1 hypothetical protein A5643_15640 [Mycobacterium sp. 1274756.6]